jgi:hypothetical protein
VTVFTLLESTGIWIPLQNYCQCFTSESNVRILPLHAMLDYQYFTWSPVCLSAINSLSIFPMSFFGGRGRLSPEIWSKLWRETKSLYRLCICHVFSGNGPRWTRMIYSWKWKTTRTQSIQKNIVQQDHRCIVENINIALNCSTFSSQVSNTVYLIQFQF